ncbi:MAG: hypothetical protein AAFR67_03330 [Chloroflexota bacterium]
MSFFQSYPDDDSQAGGHKVDRLLDAIDLIKSDRNVDALPILRSIIREDSNFESAWLWMSLAVDDIDQSIICLDNVLRINPDNLYASTALYRLRKAELAAQRSRERIRRYRDIALTTMWILILTLLFSVIISAGNNMGVPPV